jgi:hypothetical protein
VDIAATLSVILGGLITILVAVSIEFMRRPRLVLEIAPPVDNQYPNGHPAQRVRFLRLRVTNRALPRCLRFISRLTASQCAASITFHRLDGQRVQARAMEGRWAGLPEPVPGRIQIGGQVGEFFDSARTLVGQRIDVPAGESELLDVAAKFDDEPHFYGWSNANYFSDPIWRPSEWRLEPECLLVKVVLRSIGERFEGLFRLVGDAGLAGFRLELSLQQVRALNP